MKPLMGKPEMSEEPEQQPEQPQPPAAEAPPTGTQVPPKMQDAYQRTLTAGLKVLYSDETREQVVEALKSGPDPAESMATMAASIMMELSKQSQGKMPREVMLPAAMVLLAYIAEMAHAVKIELNEEMLATATRSMLDKLSQGQAAPAQQPPAPQPQPEMATQRQVA